MDIRKINVMVGRILCEEDDTSSRDLGLKHGEDPDENFDADELKMGISVEKEHSDDPKIAKSIAKAHLAEIPDYYTRLKKMEKEAGVADESMKKRYGMSEKIRKPNGKAQKSQKLMFRR